MTTPGPVEAVLTEAERDALAAAYRGPWGPSHALPERIPAAVESILTARLAEHGAAERRAGAVEALNEAADDLYGDTRAKGPHSHSLSVETWLRARAAALGDRADEGGA